MAFQSQIDELDKKILSLVSKNARIPYLEVARECNVSGAAIHQRIQRLIKLGVITGSEFIISPRSIGLLTCAYMGIYLTKASLYSDVLKQLEQIPEIVECHYTTGVYSLFVKVVTRDNEHLRDVLADKLQKVEGIERTETFISLEENFKRQFPIS
ncbi:MAG: Lrp/AsnC ligand binding domain-containing protein [Salinivirgaceae bacterium]|nr:Lrp/AsnC ligand binding domain-containing protein [Salinivirgaceae bacterium]